MERVVFNSRFGYNPYGEIVVAIMEKRGQIERGLMNDLTNDPSLVTMIQGMEGASQEQLANIAKRKIQAAQIAATGGTIGDRWYMRFHAIGASMGLFDDDIAGFIAPKVMLDKDKIADKYDMNSFFERYGGRTITDENGERIEISSVAPAELEAYKRGFFAYHLGIHPDPAAAARKYSLSIRDKNGLLSYQKWAEYMKDDGDWNPVNWANNEIGRIRGAGAGGGECPCVGRWGCQSLRHSQLI